MGVSLKSVIAALPADERKAVRVRSAQLIEQEMTLREIRSAMGRTQAAVAAKLGIKQENVSRIEKRADLMLSTLNDYLGAMGGRLTLVAEFEGRDPVKLTGFSSDRADKPTTIRQKEGR